MPVGRCLCPLGRSPENAALASTLLNNPVLWCFLDFLLSFSGVALFFFAPFYFSFQRIWGSVKGRAILHMFAFFFSLLLSYKTKEKKERDETFCLKMQISIAIGCDFLLPTPSENRVLLWECPCCLTLSGEDCFN